MPVVVVEEADQRYRDRDIKLPSLLLPPVPGVGRARISDEMVDP
jgi:hypothetical protein